MTKANVTEVTLRGTVYLLEIPVLDGIAMQLDQMQQDLEAIKEQLNIGPHLEIPVGPVSEQE